MTMDTQHPLDERLAAYADGDADVTTDATLRAHVTSCERCGLVVRDLAMLRSALAELPDLVPSRPLRFLPPVEATVAALGGFSSLVRRLFAPALVTGAALVLAGSVGMAAPAATSLLGGRAGAAATDMTKDSNAEGVTAGYPSPVAVYGPDGTPRGGGSEAAAPAPQSNGTRGDAQPSPMSAIPWLALTIIGAAVVIVSLVLRWTVLPAAGTRSPPF